MKQTKDLNSIINLIQEHNRFLITSHVSPDGDNIGSSLALQLFLEQLGKKVKFVIDDEVPDCFSFLAENKEVINYNEEVDFDFEVAFTLDSGDISRIGDVINLIDDKTVVNIDHHADNTLYGDYNLVTDASATGELIYQLINELNITILNQDIATCIATALITDTGSFRYSNTTSQTHEVMAELLKFDVDTDYITRHVFENNSYESLILRGKALQNLKLDESNQIAWLKISQNLLEEVEADWEDAEGIVGYPRSLTGVEVAILFKEYAADEIKVSLRSNDFFAVNKIAHKFGGGGHAKAAGCLINSSLEKAEKKVLTAVKEKMKEY